jgi:hypothetical protein
MKNLRRVFAYILVAFFVMMILGVSVHALNKQTKLVKCKESKLAAYRPCILTGYDQSDVVEPTEPE